MICSITGYLPAFYQPLVPPSVECFSITGYLLAFYQALSRVLLGGEGGINNKILAVFANFLFSGPNKSYKPRFIEPLQETCWLHNVYMHIKNVWEDVILILGNLQLRTAKRIEISRTYLN